MTFQPTPLIHGGNAIEFTAAEVGGEREGIGVVDALETPSEDVAVDTNFLVINGVIQDIEPYVANALARAVIRSSELESEKFRVDCNAFAILMCGGTYEGAPFFRYVNTHKEIHCRTITDAASSLEALRLLEPLLIGHPANDRIGDIPLSPTHMMVPIDVRRGLLAHKYGELDIVISDVAKAQEHYYATKVASVLRLVYDYHGDTVLRYDADDALTSPTANIWSTCPTEPLINPA